MGVTVPSMGIVKDVKANVAEQHASRAIAEGRTVFVYKYAAGVTNGSISGPIAGVAEAIEAIERVGWRLFQMTYDEGAKHGAVVLLFRR